MSSKYFDLAVALTRAAAAAPGVRCCLRTGHLGRHWFVTSGGCPTLLGECAAVPEPKDEPEPDACPWCGQTLTDRAQFPYCSLGCGVRAELDE